MSRLTTPITYNDSYAVLGYVEGNYFTNSSGEYGVKLTHTSGSVSFAKAFKFPQWGFEFIQPSSSSAAGHPAYFSLLVSQMPFEAVFTWVSDAELAALRTWMFSTVPAFDSFDMVLFGSSSTLKVRLAKRSLKVTQLRKGFNEVTISFVRV